MKNFLRLYRSAEGQGNIGYDDAPSDTAGQPLTGANDGTSTDLATGKIVQLGQAVGRAGNPATLTEAREIPDGQATGNHFAISLGRNNGVDDIALWGSSIGYNVSNKTGRFFQGIGTFGPNQAKITLLSDDGVNARMQFESTSGGIVNIDFNDDAANPKRFDINAPWIMDTGWGTNGDTLIAAGAAYTLLKTDAVKLINTVAGNQVINIDVVAGGYAKQRFDFKKISADANTVTLNMVAGTIQGIGAAAATFVFNNPGESISVWVDILNAYII